MKNNEFGLTLIELMITIFIIVILAVVVLPRMDLFVSNNPKIFIRKFSGEIKYYYNQAVLKKTSFRFVIDLNDKNSYTIYKFSDNNWDVEKDKIKLPKGVFFNDLVVNNNIIESGTGEINFYSLGYMDRTIIHLIDENKNNYSLITTPLTGSVEIFDKYIGTK